MKTLLYPLLIGILFLGSAYGNSCVVPSPVISDKWQTMADPCKTMMEVQVQKEINASLTYLAMGAHFSKYDVNRPGFAKFFFESASEEREHAIKIISYLLMRTNLDDKLDNLITKREPLETKWGKGVEALEYALNLETTVTAAINHIIKTCEGGPNEEGESPDTKPAPNDYHLVDYLSGEFLEEQYKSQRELVGMISTLKKMEHAYSNTLGEYLFDKKLLNNELFS